MPCQQTQLEVIQNPLFHNYLSTTSFTPRQLQHRPPLRQNQPIVIREITASYSSKQLSICHRICQNHRRWKSR